VYGSGGGRRDQDIEEKTEVSAWGRGEKGEANASYIPSRESTLLSTSQREEHVTHT